MYSGEIQNQRQGGGSVWEWWTKEHADAKQDQKGGVQQPGANGGSAPKLPAQSHDHPGSV